MSPLVPHPISPCLRRTLRARLLRARRGFTLVEVLVAATAGLVVAAATFLLSKNAMDSFQQEARISTAQLAAQLGMTRLTADIMRAGYMASADLNNTDNPDLCGPVDPVFNSGTFQFQAVQIIQDGSAAAAPQSTDAANGLSPDAIELVGNYSTTEMFPVAAIDPGGANIWLQVRTGPMFRTIKEILPTGDEAAYDALLEEIFPAGRMLRLIDDVGKESYTVITGSDAVGGAAGAPPDTMLVTVDAGVPLPTAATEGNCGLSGFGTGLVVNPVSRIRYELRSLVGDANYGILMTGTGTGIDATEALLTGDAGRVELVRTENYLDNSDPPIRRELVAEYATDLQFGLTAACQAASLPCVAEGDGEPFPVRLQIGGPNDGDIAAVPPSRIRAVHARFSTRARVPDRIRNIGPAADDGRPQYFFVPGIPGSEFAGREPIQFARMRTLYTEIGTPNLNGVTW